MLGEKDADLSFELKAKDADEGSYVGVVKLQVS